MFNPEKSNFNPQETPPQPKELPEQDFEVGAKSVASEEHPDRNEDAMLQLPEKKIFGVLDGVGGMAAGEEASRLAKEYIEEALKKLPENISSKETEAALEELLKEANARILEEWEKNPARYGMSTTASVVRIFEGEGKERKAIIGNVGDSRVYLRHSDGGFEQVTLDDSIVRVIGANEEEARLLQDKLNNIEDPDTLTEEERGMFDRRNVVYQVLGMKAIKPRIYTIDISEGDRLILTSDGIHDNLTDKEIAAILEKSKSSGEAVDNLIKSAQERSRSSHPRAKADDMSAIVAESSRVIRGKELG